MGFLKGLKDFNEFCRGKLDSFLFNSRYFPGYPSKQKKTFIIEEQEFMKLAIDRKRNSLFYKNGLYALFILIINDILYAINFRRLKAFFFINSGEKLYQITRDQKPNDSI